MSEGVQDSGNPVLDSTVNLATAFALQANVNLKIEDVRAIHELVLELAQKEPNGLKRRGQNGSLFPKSASKP